MLKHLNHIRERHESGDRGFTLIEVLIAIMILMIIVGPLVMTAVTSMRVTDDVAARLRAASSRDMLASAFTRDVTSVDASGVSIASIRACESANTTADDTMLVSFNSTAPDGRISRASYWIVGSDDDTSVVRRFCQDTQYGTLATGGSESVLAVRIGGEADRGQPHLNLVHGPTRPEGGALRNPCNELFCTIEIEGRYQWQVTAQRRVFGAGVPAQANKLYSSSGTTYKTLRSHTGARLPNTQQEFDWVEEGQRFSTIPGLDGPDVQTVYFQLRYTSHDEHQTEYFFMDPDRDDPTGAAWQAVSGSTEHKDDTWVPFEAYNSATAEWTQHFEMVNFPQGGDYKIWTYIIPNDGGGAKQYGGSNGYPLWIDWKQADTIFVSPNGSDLSDGLSPQAAKVSIEAGLQASQLEGRPNIAIVNHPAWPDLYSGIVVGGDGQNRTVVGGHDPTSWKRAAPGDPGGRTRLLGAPNSGVGLVVDGAPGFGLRQMAVDSGSISTDASAGLSGRSTYGIKVLNSGQANPVRLENSHVKAHDAQDGARGRHGTGGGNPTTGQTQAAYACWGLQGQESTSTNSGHRIAQASVAPRETQAACTAGIGLHPERSNGSGGRGGPSAFLGGDPGENGGNGADGTSMGGLGGDQPGNSGRNGRGGQNGPNEYGPMSGEAAAAPSNAPTNWVDGDWSGQIGSKGSDGNAGYGGAGGGGGRGGGGFGHTHGTSGGSGGIGGAPGTGGEGGLPGGASLGVAVVSSRLAIDQYIVRDASNDFGTRIEAGKGGNGGRGGDGGDGGYGGFGGHGNAVDCCVRGSGAPGAGGSGGGAGGSGGGGQGGPSYAIYLAPGTGTVVGTIGALLVPGSPGQGGVRGENGVPGLGGDAGAADSGGWSFFGFTPWPTRTDTSINGLAARENTSVPYGSMPGFAGPGGGLNGDSCGVASGGGKGVDLGNCHNDGFDN